ncbi:MAG TPA: hypothetical protein VG796_23930 [Verrucomicrobiales bacterium]|nr:hypothetical protein [Verrucomicrobiales bacterium]
MNSLPATRTSAIALCLLGCATANAHISYTGRNFGTFAGGEAPVTILDKVIAGNWAWADGTDDDYGPSEYVRAYRFTLMYDARVTFDISATTTGGTVLGDLLPGFSFYRGLAHLPPALLDHDENLVSEEWRNSQPGVPKEGNFRALGDWKIGNDAGLTAADLSSFTFMGYGVDGTSANFGPTPGIVGDGLADGHIIKTFNVPAGDYTLFIGGADYAAQVGGDLTGRGVNVTLSVIPEPAVVVLLLPAVASLLLGRRR